MYGAGGPLSSSCSLVPSSVSSSSSTSSTTMTTSTSTTNSASTPTNTPHLQCGGAVAFGAQSCTATDHGAWNSYSIDIGVTLTGGAQCDDIYNKLDLAANDVLLTDWQCVADPCGYIQLWFDVTSGSSQIGSELNTALTGLFPSVNG